MKSGLKFSFVSGAGAMLLALPGLSFAQDVTGAGASFPAPLYSKWAADYNKATGVKTKESGDTFLAHIKELYGLSSVAYLGLNIPDPDGGCYFQNTYSDAWRVHYISNEFVSIDPVVRRGLLSLLPQEWHELEALLSPKAREIITRRKIELVRYQDT